jgi:hypothetical protein
MFHWFERSFICMPGCFEMLCVFFDEPQHPAIPVLALMLFIKMVMPKG